MQIFLHMKQPLRMREKSIIVISLFINVMLLLSYFLIDLMFFPSKIPFKRKILIKTTLTPITELICLYNHITYKYRSVFNFSLGAMGLELWMAALGQRAGDIKAKINSTKFLHARIFKRV